MTTEKIISSFHLLGQKIKNLSDEDLSELKLRCINENPWFTPDSVQLALDGICHFLDKQTLTHWLAKYSVKNSPAKKIGVVMAGNIPLVGFHDFLCVLICGHQLTAKLSSSDSVLLKFISQSLIEIDQAFSKLITFEERLKNIDAVIATGSDNSSRYFEYYFRNIPHIIRKNRTSCAVITGEESPEEFRMLGKDIFSYFGLGCRNVSKIYVPEGFDFSRLIKSWDSFQPIIHHHKYANNYDYQKSILLINQIHFYDSGFLLITKNENLVSPISMIYYEFYLSQEDLSAKLKLHEEKIQCTVSAKGWFKNSIPFGLAQSPQVEDYADGVDTVDFLKRI